MHGTTVEKRMLNVLQQKPNSELLVLLSYCCVVYLHVSLSAI